MPGLVALGLLFGGLDSGIGKSALALVAAIVLVWLLLRDTPHQRFWRAVWPVYALIAVAAAWATLASSGVLRSAHGSSALTPDLLSHELIGLAGYAAVLLVATLLGYRRNRLAPLCDWLIGFIVVDAVIGWLMRESGDTPLFSFWSQSVPDRFPGTFNNANVAGAVYGAAAALTLSRMLERDRQSWTSLSPGAIAQWAALIVSVAAVVLSASRAGMVTMIFAFAAVAIVGIGRSRRRRISVARTALLGVVLLLALTGQISFQLMNRFGMLGSHSIKRAELWTHFIQIVGQSPWLGYGLGSFPTVNGRYLGDPHLAQQIWTVNSPHDWVLHLMLQAGLPYLLLMLAAAGIVIAAIIGRLALRTTPTSEIGLAIAAIVLIASATIDIALEVPAVVALWLVIAGLLWGRALRSRFRTSLAHRRPA